MMSRSLPLSLAIIILSVYAGTASAAVFTVNIFDLKNNRRAGQVVTVTVTAVDSDNNLVTNPRINFDGDRDAAGALVISTQKDVDTGRTVVTVDDERVSAVTFTFTGSGLLTTTDQRFRNVANLEYEVSVPDNLARPYCASCRPFRLIRRLCRR